jgi:hypothetical protein
MNQKAIFTSLFLASALFGAASTVPPAYAWLGNDIVNTGRAAVHTVTHPLQTVPSVVSGAARGVVGGVSGTVQHAQGIISNPGATVQGDVQTGVENGIKQGVEGGDGDE